MLPKAKHNNKKTSKHQKRKANHLARRFEAHTLNQTKSSKTALNSTGYARGLFHLGTGCFCAFSSRNSRHGGVNRTLAS
jgi:hypothetical protein